MVLFSSSFPSTLLSFQTAPGIIDKGYKQYKHLREDPFGIKMNKHSYIHENIHVFIQTCVPVLKTLHIKLKINVIHMEEM